MYDINKLSFVDIGARSFKLGKLDSIKENLEYHAFEPDLIEYERLSNKKSDVKTFFYPVALSDKNEKTNFYITKDPACSSLLMPNEKIFNDIRIGKKLELVKSIKIQTNTLDWWKNEYDIGAIDILKIDVQGGELKVFSKGHNTLENTIAIMSEIEFVEVYKNQPTFQDIDTHLRKLDFELIDITKILAKNNEVGSNFKTKGKLVWGDAIYIKNYKSMLAAHEYDEERFRVVLRYIMVYEYFDRMDLSYSLISNAITDSLISDSVLLGKLLEIKDEINRVYSSNTKLGLIERVILKFANTPLFRRIHSIITNVDERNKYMLKSNHQKYFWTNE